MPKRSLFAIAVSLLLVVASVTTTTAQNGSRPGVNELLAGGNPVFGFFGDQRADDGGAPIGGLPHVATQRRELINVRNVRKLYCDFARRERIGLLNRLLNRPRPVGRV